MSKRSGTWGVRLSLSSALCWFKIFTNRSLTFADRLVCFGERRPNDEFEDIPEANRQQSFKIEFYGDRLELRELTEVLRIGDRVRLFCDDGVLVAEKISRTQLKIIHSQPVVERIQ